MSRDLSDDGLFQQWYQAEHPRVLGLLSVVAGDRDIGREATAEAFTRALERWDRVGKMDSPAAWTYRVGVNIVRRRRWRSAFERSHRLVASESAPCPDVDLDVWAAVRRLPCRQRTVIALRYVCDLTNREIAAAMGVAVGTVSATMTSAHRGLAAQLERPPSVRPSAEVSFD